MAGVESLNKVTPASREEQPGYFQLLCFVSCFAVPFETRRFNGSQDSSCFVHGQGCGSYQRERVS